MTLSSLATKIVVDPSTIKQKDCPKQYVIEELANGEKELVIDGWSRSSSLPSKFYDDFFSSDIPVKRLILRGRGVWTSCRCAKNGHKNGKTNTNLSKLTYIHVTNTFRISACILLDLIAHSPNLKTLSFHGVLETPEHSAEYVEKHFRSDLTTVIWPWPLKEHFATIKTIVKRNENITTMHSDMMTICKLLSFDILVKLRYMSVYMREDWGLEKTDKLSKYAKYLKYLGIAENIVGLEIRALNFNEPDEEQRSKQNAPSPWEIYRSYRLKFWDEVAKWNKLKYLAIFGGWEFEEVCRDIANRGLPIQYLKINLMPKSLVQQRGQDDAPILSCVEGFKNLRKLSTLKSLEYICPEMLGTIDGPTVASMKDLIDIIWALRVQTKLDGDVFNLVSSILKRANQQGKMFKLLLNITPREQPHHQFLFDTGAIRYNSDFQSTINSKVERELVKRKHKKSSLDAIYVWSVLQIDNSRDKSAFRSVEGDWTFYGSHFEVRPIFE